MKQELQKIKVNAQSEIGSEVNDIISNNGYETLSMNLNINPNSNSKSSNKIRVMRNMEETK